MHGEDHGGELQLGAPSESRQSEYAMGSGTLDEAGLNEIFMWEDMDAENEDPLGLLYLEPGSIEPNVAAAAAAAAEAATTTTTASAEAGSSSSAAGKAVVPSLARVNTIEMESSAVTQLRELSVLCGEDPADILACVTPKAGNDSGAAASMAQPVGVPLID